MKVLSDSCLVSLAHWLCYQELGCRIYRGSYQLIDPYDQALMRVTLVPVIVRVTFPESGLVSSMHPCSYSALSKRHLEKTVSVYDVGSSSMTSLATSEVMG